MQLTIWQYSRTNNHEDNTRKWTNLIISSFLDRNSLLTEWEWKEMDFKQIVFWILQWDISTKISYVWWLVKWILSWKLNDVSWSKDKWWKQTTQK